MSSKSKNRRFSDSSIQKSKKSNQSTSPPHTPLPIMNNTPNQYNQNYFYYTANNNDDVYNTIPQNTDSNKKDENEHKLTNMQIFASAPTTSPFEPHQSTTTTNNCSRISSSSNSSMNNNPHSTSNYQPPIPTNDSIINSQSNQIINSMNFNELSNCIVTIENNNQNSHQQILSPTASVSGTISTASSSTSVTCPFQYGEIESNSITTVPCPPYLIYPNNVDNSCCYNSSSSIGNNHHHLLDDCSESNNTLTSPLYSDDDNNENDIFGGGCNSGSGSGSGSSNNNFVGNSSEESEFIQIDFMNSDYVRKLLTSSNDDDNDGDFDDLENYFKDILS